ncbi:MAG: hypothetical protein JNK02_14960 [Planctomycetes bacterium]|nr:hypothetical protein [Planctomycetota bacterium]
MSTTPALSCLATLALACATFESREAAQAQAQSADLAAEVLALKQSVEAQAKDVAEAKQLAEKSARYAAEQAKAAAALAAVLDESEKAGFTYGINPESRVVLLRGWRDALAAAQREVPPVPEPTKTAQARR